MTFSPKVEELIRQFRGLPVDDADSSKPPPRRLDSVLETCIERYHIGRKTPEETLLENWPRVIGQRFAARCRPVRIDRSGSLVIQIHNATLRRELMFMEDRILTAVASLPDCDHIQRIVFKS